MDNQLKQQRRCVSRDTRVFTATRIFLALIIAGLLAPCALGETRIYCYQKVIEPGAAGGGKIQVAGFTIEVKPIPDSDDAERAVCRATVTAPNGKLVYSFNEWGAEIDQVTGKDINGDGEPDAVLVSYSGGAHCCWTYHIVSLGKKPGLLREFENQDTASFDDLKGNGEVEIVIRDGGFDFGFGLDHAFSVFPMLIVQLRGIEFFDVSSEFWPMFEKEINEKRDSLSGDRIQDFLHRDRSIYTDNLEYDRTKSAILLMVIDYLYGGKPDQAKKLLNTLWPKDSQEQTWTEIMTGFCSGLRSQLGIAKDASCTRK